VEDLPSDDGVQNDKQRSCFGWGGAPHLLVFQLEGCETLTRDTGDTMANAGGSVVAMSRNPMLDPVLWQRLERHIRRMQTDESSRRLKRWSADIDPDSALLPEIEAVVSGWDLRLSPAIVRKAESDITEPTAYPSLRGRASFCRGILFTASRMFRRDVCPNVRWAVRRSMSARSIDAVSE
jgi:hypothetical protein